MPLYLCKHGAGQAEPWRHGISVYAAPFSITNTPGSPIRRIRHAEVVLVDDICIAHGRYWLRLRWPGSRGGFAGYLPMGRVQGAKVTVNMPDAPNQPVTPGENLSITVGQPTQLRSLVQGRVVVSNSPSLEERVLVDDADWEGREETASMNAIEPPENAHAVVSCLRTNLPFESSESMQLLPSYEDGICPSVSVTTVSQEPVLCRICREGLHEDADDEQPSPAAENDNDGDAPVVAMSRQSSTADSQTEANINRSTSANEEAEEDDDTAMLESLPGRGSDAETENYQGPVLPQPVYTANPHALENPLLAPCQCTGSMAFVHYLCVEQWRCRSRHPVAQNGLNCETCGSAYALPPPSSRPATLDHEDLLEAMPPHVMQALRQPHIWWQLGAAIVRRRWLRPIAPVLMSPIVALYCKARRLLKKRGVARRRWACSLCRRRARWKCVRCLRSYYCSRQCQNVSWHIVHKHVCYKPIRFWSSVVFYTAATLALFPGILRDPLMYDLGIIIIPLSFVVIGIIAGSIATVLKKSFGLDLRGRLLELAVVLGTIWLTIVSWGLVQGFFGHPDACRGHGGRFSVTPETLKDDSSILLRIWQFILKPSQGYYLWVDGLVDGSYPFVRRLVCSRGDDAEGCFERLPGANADLFIQDPKCAADVLLVVWMYVTSVVAYAGSAYYKARGRRQRAMVQGNRHHRQQARQLRPHQD